MITTRDGSQFTTFANQVQTAAQALSTAAANSADALSGPLQTALTSIAGQYGFPAVSQAMDHTSLDVEQKSQMVIQALTNITQTGTGPMVTNAKAALNQLDNTYQTDLGQMATQVTSAWAR